jgi:hypothetical protein
MSPPQDEGLKTDVSQIKSEIDPVTPFQLEKLLVKFVDEIMLFNHTRLDARALHTRQKPPSVNT